MSPAQTTHDDSPWHERPVVRAAAFGAVVGLALSLAAPRSPLLLLPSMTAGLMGDLQRKAGLPVATRPMEVVHAVVWGAAIFGLVWRMAHVRGRMLSCASWSVAGTVALNLPLFVFWSDAAMPLRATAACTYSRSMHYVDCPGLACENHSLARRVLLAPHRLLARASGNRADVFYPLVHLVGMAAGLGLRAVRFRRRSPARGGLIDDPRRAP